MSLETAKSANYGHMVSLGSKNNIPNFLSLAVKPAVVSSVHVSEIDGQLKLDWSPPSGQVPEHCLEYEVESSTTMENGKEKQVFSLFCFSVQLDF